MRKDIIIIDDDRDLCTLLQESLLQENICADISCNGFDGIKSVKDKEYQLVVLDVMMPGISGFEVLERIRDMSNVPILMLTAKDDSTSKVKGLRAGADDYLTKPFSVDELLARLRVTIRRLNNSQTTSVNESIYENGDLTINYAQGCVYENGREIHLTPIEYKLLCVLAKNTDKVLTHNYIMGEVWGSVQGTETPSLRVFMATLRKKIEPDTSNPKYIQTHVGVGYRMLNQTEKKED